MTMTGTASTGTQQLMQVLVSKHSTSLPGMIWSYDVFIIVIIIMIFILIDMILIWFYDYNDFDINDIIVIS